MDEPIPVAAVHLSPDEARAEELALVLASSGVAHKVGRSEGGWVLWVAAHDARRALAALDAYHAEERPAAPRRPPPPSHGPSLLGALAALLMAVAFLITGEPKASPAHLLGSADAVRILHGEPWRVVTALTLHAEVAHLLGNVAATLLVVGAVGQWLGTGLGAWLLLLAGAAGNGLTALVHRQAHVSIGASTATFAALGALGALQFVARRRAGRSAAWIAAAACLALFALLGLGERADVLAHLFGLLAGAALALPAAALDLPPPGRLAQALLALAALGAVLGAWGLALAHGHP